MHRTSFQGLSRRSPALAAASLHCLLLASCGDGWEARTSKNRGNVCFRSLQASLSDSSPVQLEADVPLKVYVESAGCLSGSCSRSRAAQCELHVDGDQITLSSRFEWEERTGEVSCTLDCIKLFAECSSTALPAGRYTLHHGDTSSQLTIPGEVTGDCGLL